MLRRHRFHAVLLGQLAEPLSRRKRSHLDAQIPVFIFKLGDLGAQSLHAVAAPQGFNLLPHVHEESDYQERP